MIRVGRRRDKIEVFVKCLGLVVLGMYGKGANTRNLGRLESSQQGVFQKAGAEPFSLKPSGNRKAGQQHDGNGVSREPLRQALRSLLEIDLADDKRVVAGNAFISQSNVRLRRARLLILKSKANEKPIEGLAATIE